MPLTALTSANSVTNLDGTVTAFVGNAAIPSGKLRIARLDGTGTAFLSAAALSVGADRLLALFIGDSHIKEGAGGAEIGANVAASGVHLPFSALNHLFGVGGDTSTQMKVDRLPGLLTYINAQLPNYTQVLVFVGAGINDTTYAASIAAATSVVIANRRAVALALAKAGAKVIMLTTPPTVAYQVSNPAQHAIMDGARLAFDDDAVATYATEYGAVAVTTTHRNDNTLYPATAHANFPANFSDATHYTGLASGKWARLHWLPELLKAARTPAPGRLAPTALTVDTTAQTLAFTKTAADPLTLHEYSINGGTSYQPVLALPITVPSATYAIGALRVRVLAYAGGVAGAELVSTTAFTVGAPAPAAYTPGTFVNQDFMTGANRQNATVTGNTWGATTAVGSFVGDRRQFVGNGALRTTLRQAKRGVGYGLRGTGALPTGFGDFPVCAQLDIDSFAFYVRSGDTFLNGSATIPYAEGDVLEIARVGNDCTFKKNGVLAFTAVGVYTGISYALSSFCWGNSGLSGAENMLIMGVTDLVANALQP